MSGRTRQQLQDDINYMKKLLKTAYNAKNDVWDYVCDDGHRWFQEVAEVLGDDVTQYVNKVHLHVGLDGIELPGSNDPECSSSYEVVVKDKKGNVLHQSYVEVDEVEQ